MGNQYKNLSKQQEKLMKIQIDMNDLKLKTVILNLEKNRNNENRQKRF